jgi:glycerate kinase
MRVLIAFDKFKDSMTAEEACDRASEAIRERYPGWLIDRAPLTDGGDGFGRILTDSVGGETRKVAALGPLMEEREANYGLTDISTLPAAARDLLVGLPDAGRLALVEMASINGLALVSQADRTPWRTTTVGTGEVLRAASDSGAAGILLGVGGSATNDLGLGALAILGFSFHNRDGAPVHPPVPERWSSIRRIEGHLVSPIPPLWIACDVDNPLLGERGASAVFGPQKGLVAADLPRLESELGRMADLLCAHLGCDSELQRHPGSGAAGGIAFGLMAAAGARLVSGSDLMTAWLRLRERVSQADIVITGEGRFDRSSLEGKGPAEVATLALDQGKRTLVLAGSIEEGLDTQAELHPITPPGISLAQALRNGPDNLGNTVRKVIAR